MDWIYYFLGYSDNSVLTKTVYKNKGIMNEINKEVIKFNKSKLRKKQKNIKIM